MFCIACLLFIVYLKDSLHGAVDLEVWCVGWPLGEPLPDVSEGLLVEAGVAHLQRVLTLEEAGPGGVQPVLVEDLGLLPGLLEGLLADLLVFVDDRVHLSLGYHSLGDQLLRV